MVDVVTDIVIDEPLKRVSEYAADPDTAPEWYVNIRSAHWITPRPLQIGSKIQFNAQFLGRKLTYTYEIVEYAPGAKLVMRTTEGPFPMETTYTWQALDMDRTRMTLGNSGQPVGFSRLFTPTMASMIKRANRMDLKKLKAILERTDESMYERFKAT